jgi:general stress protein YciG
MAEKSRRGFAGMDPQKQREIASKGGKAAHAKGTAHEFTPEEAREAGRKGGQAAHLRGTAHQFTPEEAREAGRKGGRSSRRNSNDEPEQNPAEPSRQSEANTNGAAGAMHSTPVGMEAVGVAPGGL